MPPVNPLPEYIAGTIVRSTVTFQNQSGTADPTTVTAAAQYGTPGISPPVSLATTRVSAGVYYADVATEGSTIPTLGEVPVVVTWQGTGTLNQTILDPFLIVQPGSRAADTVGP